ncbi:MAG: hydroxyacylglutathione hydrolase [Rhodospirillales bacterium]|nr:hydroxyacylglutathione hydrolase [Rhodospirillales bacterium]
MNKAEILSVPVLNDNYVHLIHDPATGATACVDPAIAPPVIAAAEARGWAISHILITHPHGDHTDGVPEIVAKFGAQVFGSRHDRMLIPHCTNGVAEGDVVQVGALELQVLDVPGHTVHHVAYYFKDEQALFCGDTLFSLGCGRLFGGTAEQMWESLKKLRALPAETLVYCAHEYTNANADFALSIDPLNADLRARADEVQALRERGLPTVPSRMESEKRCNPFLRCDVLKFQAQLSLAGQDAADVFAEVRRRKDHF